MIYVTDYFFEKESFFLQCLVQLKVEKGAFNSTLIKLHLSKVREREERGGGVTLFYDE